MSKSPVPVEDLSYEKALKELESILSTLENESQDLETTMALYERGRALIKHCQALLDEAELKVKMLSEDGQAQEMEDEH
ncbi:MAG: exodeoxyribonuclease VII small subunit [Pelolinea sp.]|nr:exodeoxyribonuclease VII small subunit [Pelolinea sp.]